MTLLKLIVSFRTALVCLLMLLPPAARAELRHEVTPAAVSGASTAMVILEASSLHWAVHILYEDSVEQRSTQVFYGAGLTGDPARNDSLFETLFRISDSSTPEYLRGNSQSLLRIAHGVQRKKYAGSGWIDSPFPDPIVQYSVRLRHEDARALRLVLGQQAHFWGANMGVLGFNASGRASFSEALRHTRLRQSASGEVLPWQQFGLNKVPGATTLERGGLPGMKDRPQVPPFDVDGDVHGTPLAYLYAAMLSGQRRYEEARNGDAILGEGALEGCSLPDSYSVPAEPLSSTTNMVSALRSGTLGRDATLPYQILMKRAESFDEDARVVMKYLYDRLQNPVSEFDPAAWINDIYFGFLSLDTGIDAAVFMDQSLWSHPLVVEAFVLGHIDPAVIPVWQCMALRAGRGVVEPSRTLVARNVAYDAIDRHLQSLPWNTLIDGKPTPLTRRDDGLDTGSPRFFAAAHNVTRLFGVGLVDAAEKYSPTETLGNTLSAQPFGIGNMPIDLRCAGWSADDIPEIVPRARERDLLRDINFQLYRNINLTVVQKLVSTGTLFDPVNGGPLQDTTAEDADYDFDLRMVLVEQGHIQKVLDDEAAQRKYGLTEPGAYERLGNSQLALYCSRLGSLARALNPDPDAQFQVLGDLHGMLEKLKAEGIVPANQAGFEHYAWRVAVGSAYVHILHRKPQERFNAYMRKLFVEARSQPVNSVSLTPARSHELRALVAPGPAPDERLVEKWTEGLATYLATDGAALRLFACNDNPPAQQLKITDVDGVLRSRKDRILDLTREPAPGAPRGMDGLSPVVTAFEISATGNGALLPNARLDAASANRVRACSAIGAKRAALEELMLDGRLMSFLYSTDDNNFFVLERSRPLAQTQALLEPFLLRRLETIAAETPRDLDRLSRADLAGLVRDSLSEVARYQRDQALVERLASLAEHKINPLDPIELNLDKSAAELRDLANAASMTAGTTKEAGAPALDERMRRVADNATTLSDLREKVCRAVAAPSCPVATGKPSQAPIPPIEVRYPYPDMTKQDVIDGRSDLNRLPAGAAVLPGGSVGEGQARSGLFFQTTPTEDVDEDGNTLYAAELTYRLPMTKTAMLATAGAKNLTAPEDTLDLPSLQGQAALPSHRDIPLGIVFKRTRRDPVDGTISTLENVFSKDVDLQASRFAKAASLMSVPGFIEITSIAPAATIKLDNISIRMELSLLGHPLPEAVTVDLVKGNSFADPVDALRAALIAQVEKAAGQIIGEATAALDLGRFPKDIAVFDDSQLRFGPVDDLAHNIRLDWDAGTITADLGYGLSIGETRLDATANLLISSTGDIQLRQLSFDADPGNIVDQLRSLDQIGPLLTELETHADKIISAAHEVEDMLHSLQVTPVLRGSGIRLAFRQNVNLSYGGVSCTLAFSAEVGLDLANQKDLLQGNVTDNLDKQIASCATQIAATPLAAALDSLLDQTEITLFGTTARLVIDPSQLDLTALEAAGKLDIMLEIDQSRATCAPSNHFTGRIESAAFRFGPGGKDPKLDLTALSEADGKKLGKAITCQIEALMPQPIAEFVSIDAVQFLGASVLVDATIRGVPFLSDIRLNQINLSDPQLNAAAIRSLAEEAATTALGEGLSAALKQAFGDTLDLAGIGSYRFEGASLQKTSGTWWIGLEGTLKVDRYDIPETQIRIPIGGSLSDIDVHVDGGQAVLQGALTGAVEKLLKLIPNAPEITNLYFGKLDANGTRYGFRFGAKFTIPLGENDIDLEIRQAELSTDGLSLGGEITAALPVPLYFPPVALSQVLVTIVTGEEEGTRPGLKLGADLTAVEPQFARVLKLRSILDLTEIDRLAFGLRSDVIALDTVNLMWAEGKLDLANAYAQFDAEAAELIKDIIDPQVHGKLNGKTGLVYAESALDVLGVELSRNSLHICSQDCEVGGVPGEARLAVKQKMLLGDASGGARTDLRFRDPGIEAGVILDLFGWKPGGAEFNLNLGSAELEMKFLGMKVSVITPTYKTLDPGLVARILQDLLKIDLKSLLKKPPKDITISLIKPSGAVQTTMSSQPPAKQDAPDQGQGTPPTGPPAPAPSEEANGAPPPGDGTAPEEDLAPKQELWGAAVTARVCERYRGPPDNSAIEPEYNHFYFIWGYRPEPGREPWSAWWWTPWDFPVRPWDTWPRLAGPAMSKLCEKDEKGVPEGHRFIIPDQIVALGAKRYRGWGGVTCNDNGSANTRVYIIEDKDRFQQAGLPLLCLEDDDRRIVVDSSLYYDRENTRMLVVPRCPSTAADAFAGAGGNSLFRRLCRNKTDPLLHYPLSETGFDFSNEVRTISAIEELRFYEQVVMPDLLKIGKPANTDRPVWKVDGFDYALHPNEIRKDNRIERVTFLIETTGDTRWLETRQLERLASDGSESLMFKLYTRARDDAAWRPIFFKLYEEYRQGGEAELEFLTEDVTGSKALILHDRGRDRDHAWALKWIWLDGTEVREGLSYIPRTLPVPEGPLNYGVDDLRSLAALQEADVMAPNSPPGPVRMALGISLDPDFQLRLSFVDMRCTTVTTAASSDTPDPCLPGLGTLPDETMIRVLVAPVEDRKNLAKWPAPDSDTAIQGCISKGDLRNRLGRALRLGGPASAGQVDRLFFDLNAFTRDYRNFNQEPLMAFQALATCP